MIALISDIHGNHPALKAVLAEIDAVGCETIVSLGDVAGYHCLLNDCIDLLRARQVINLMGNHDHYLVSGTRSGRSKAADRCLELQARTVTPENFQWLQQSRSSLTLGEAEMVHGGWQDPLDEYLYVLREDYFASRPGTCFFSGHTHVPVLQAFGAKLYCNPGSVGQPRDGDPRASFALFNGNAVSLRRVGYDIDAMAAAMRLAGFEPYYFENLYSGTSIGGAISTVRVEIG